MRTPIGRTSPSIIWKLLAYTLAGVMIVVLPHVFGRVHEPRWLELLAGIAAFSLLLIGCGATALICGMGPRFRTLLTIGFALAFLGWLVHLSKDIERTRDLALALFSSMLYAGAMIGGICVVVSGLLFIYNQLRLRHPADDSAALS